MISSLSRMYAFSPANCLGVKKFPSWIFRHDLFFQGLILGLNISHNCQLIILELNFLSSNAHYWSFDMTRFQCDKIGGRNSDITLVVDFFLVRWLLGLVYQNWKFGNVKISIRLRPSTLLFMCIDFAFLLLCWIEFKSSLKFSKEVKYWINIFLL